MEQTCTVLNKLRPDVYHLIEGEARPALTKNSGRSMLAAMPSQEPSYGFCRHGCTQCVFNVSADAVAQSAGVGAQAGHTKQRGAGITGTSGQGNVDTPIAFQAVRDRADLDVFAIMLRLTKGADALLRPVEMVQALASIQIDASFAARTAHRHKDDARPNIDNYFVQAAL